MRHYEIKDLRADRLLAIVITLFAKMVILDSEAHVILVDCGVLSDEVRVHLLLLGVFEHHLDESLKVVRNLWVFA